MERVRGIPEQAVEGACRRSLWQPRQPEGQHPRGGEDRKRPREHYNDRQQEREALEALGIGKISLTTYTLNACFRTMSRVNDVDVAVLALATAYGEMDRAFQVGRRGI